MGKLRSLLFEITEHNDKLFVHRKDYGKGWGLLCRYKFLNNMKDIKKFPNIAKHLNVDSSERVVRQISILLNKLFGDLESGFKKPTS